MTGPWSVQQLLLVTAATYGATTFSVWFGHRFAHRPGGLLSGFHLRGHHAIYPRSDRCTSDGSYQGGEGGTNSAFALLPWLLLQTALALVVLPWAAGLLSFLETVLLLIAINYVHEQFHRAGSTWERFGWFAAARRVHFVHHDEAVNFMVFDHTWDRLFKTYAPPRPPVRSRERTDVRSASGS
jgi:sterol desaturase/sphingolipid hydroxylase (fatty acid hydroxylase superfamily)